MQDGGAAVETEPGEGAFAEADVSGAGRRRWYEESAQEVGEIGIVADDEEVFGVGVVLQQLMEVLEGGGGG